MQKELDKIFENKPLLAGPGKLPTKPFANLNLRSDKNLTEVSIFSIAAEADEAQKSVQQESRARKELERSIKMSTSTQTNPLGGDNTMTQTSTSSL